MDSSSVCCLAAGLLGRPPSIYSVGYGAGEYDETDGIRPLARQLGGPWRLVQLSNPNLFEDIGRLVRITDGPVCTVTWLSHYHLVRTAAEDGRDIIFSGLGGDECLAGEYEHFLYYFSDLKIKGDENRLKDEIAGWMRLHDHPIFRKNEAVVQDVFNRLVDLNRPGLIRPDMARYRTYQKYFRDDFVREYDRRPEMACPYDSYLTNRCYQDLFFETTPPSLKADESNVSAFGLKTRFPFLDRRVVEFCFSLPGTVKYDRGGDQVRHEAGHEGPAAGKQSKEYGQNRFQRPGRGLAPRPGPRGFIRPAQVRILLRERLVEVRGRGNALG